MSTLSKYLGPLDESHALPLYQQLQRSLRDAIEKRMLGPDDALPPERDLADALSVSRITVRPTLRRSSPFLAVNPRRSSFPRLALRLKRTLSNDPG